MAAAPSMVVAPIATVIWFMTFPQGWRIRALYPQVGMVFIAGASGVIQSVSLFIESSRLLRSTNRRNGLWLQFSRR